MPISPVQSQIVAAVARPRPPGATGAFAEETEDSRIGLQTGMLGAQNVTRKWRVYTLNRGDNPVVTMESLSAANGGVQAGSTFPRTGGWGDGSYVLFYFTILDHWPGTNVWIIQGNYVPSYLAALPQTLWNFDIDSPLETERVYSERPKYVDGVLQPSRGIGAPRYIYARPLDSRGIFSAYSLVQGTAHLKLAGGGTDPYDASLPRFMVGADVPKRTSTIVFTKTVASWASKGNAIQAAWLAKGFVNLDAFRVNTTSGQILFADDPSVNPLGGIAMLAGVQARMIPNPTGGGSPSFAVTLTVKIDGDGWKDRKNHTYKFQEDGTEAPITKAGKPVVEYFDVLGETSLTAVLGAF